MIRTHQFEEHDIRTIDGHEGAVIVAVDLARAIGNVNTTLATKKVDPADKRIIWAMSSAGNETRLIVLNRRGVETMLSTKASERARACLDWCYETLFPQIYGDTEEDPMAAIAAAARMTRQEAPWAAIAADYQGQALFEDPGDHTLWATQKQIAGIYGTTVPNICMHLQNLFNDGFLVAAECIITRLIAENEGDRTITKEIILYNFRAICGVGDRVSTAKGQAFREWRADYLEQRLTAQSEMEATKDRHIGLLKALYKDPTAVEETLHQLDRFVRFHWNNDRMLEERILENVHPFTLQPLTSREDGDQARAQLKDFRDRCAKIRNEAYQEIGRYPKAFALVPLKVSKLAHCDGTILDIALPKTDPDDPDGLDKADRKLASEKRSMDLAADERVLKRLKMIKRNPSAFKGVEVGRHAAGVNVFDADRAADIHRYEIASDDARLLIDAAIARGERFLITSDFEEITADWAKWVAADTRRAAAIEVFIDPDKKSRDARLARLAQAFADDGETRH